MINSNELRIGNWVRHNNHWSYRKSFLKDYNFQWNEYDFYSVGESTMSYDCIDPIPLTEDKPVAGFEEKDLWYYGENQLVVKHLHQLQNLYFALTNQELIFKP